MNGGAEVTAYSSPRRLAVTIDGVLGAAARPRSRAQGPCSERRASVPTARPTKALEGFARSCGVTVDALQKVSDGKAEYFVFRTRKTGEAIDDHLAGIVQAAVKDLPIPKLMRWGDARRPVRAPGARPDPAATGPAWCPGKSSVNRRGIPRAGTASTGRASCGSSMRATMHASSRPKARSSRAFETRRARIAELLRTAVGQTPAWASTTRCSTR